MTKWIHALAAAAGLALASPVALAEDVTMEQLPQPVRQTLQRELGQAQVHEIERDRHGDRVVYEVKTPNPFFKIIFTASNAIIAFVNLGQCIQKQNEKQQIKKPAYPQVVAIFLYKVPGYTI